MSSKKKPVSKNPWAGLTNEELLYLFYRIDDIRTKIETGLENHKFSKIITDLSGERLISKSLSYKDVEEYKKEEHYILLQSVFSKLKSLAPLIEESDISMKKLAEKLK